MIIKSYTFDAPLRLSSGGGLIIDWNIKVSKDEVPDYCNQCKFAHPLATNLFTCDGDEEPLVYCEKHEVFCRAQRPACDWAAISIE